MICLLFILTSCHGTKPTCYELYSAVTPENLSVSVYPYKTDMTYASFFSRLYYGEKNNTLPDEFTYCDDYYVAIGSQSDIWELHIFHTVSEYDTERVINMLMKRKERLQKENNASLYSEKGYERIQAAVIFTVEKYVVLSITDHNSLIEQEIRKSI